MTLLRYNSLDVDVAFVFEQLSTRGDDVTDSRPNILEGGQDIAESGFKKAATTGKLSPGEMKSVPLGQEEVH